MPNTWKEPGTSSYIRLTSSFFHKQLSLSYKNFPTFCAHWMTCKKLYLKKFSLTAGGSPPFQDIFKRASKMLEVFEDQTILYLLNVKILLFHLNICWPTISTSKRGKECSDELLWLKWWNEKAEHSSPVIWLLSAYIVVLPMMVYSWPTKHYYY